jgi:hypothetical protein
VNFTAVQGTRIDATRPARPGELVTVNVSGLADAAAIIAPARVTVTVGITQQPAVQVAPAGGGSHNIQFILDQFMGAGTQPLSVSIDGRTSNQIPFPVRAN